MRNETLLKQRNDKIIERYNELTASLKDWEAYKQLRQEFFLTNRMLYCIVSGEFEKSKQRLANRQQNPNQLTIFSHE